MQEIKVNPDAALKALSHLQESVLRSFDARGFNLGQSLSWSQEVDGVLAYFDVESMFGSMKTILAVSLFDCTVKPEIEAAMCARSISLRDQVHARKTPGIMVLDRFGEMIQECRSKLLEVKWNRQSELDRSRWPANMTTRGVVGS